MRGVWGRTAVGFFLAAMLVPVVASDFISHGPSLHLLVALVTVAFWQTVFRVKQGTPFAASGAVTAVSFSLLAAGELAVWQIVLSVSFGVVLAELLFGGWGRNFVSGAVVAPAFAYLSFPEVMHPPPVLLVALGAGLSGVVLLAAGLIAWRVLASAGLVAVLCWAAGALPPDALGALFFAAVFLLADPVAAASTLLGRLGYGALGAGLAGLFLASGFAVPQAVVYAVFLAQIFAPLIDQAAITFHVYRRSHG